MKTMWPLGNFVLQCWPRQSWWLHDLWSKLNQEPRVAAAFVDSHNAKAKNCQINQRMNDHQSLLFCSLPVCPFSMTWQPLSFHSMLPTSSYLGTWIPFLPVIPDFPETDIWKRQNINPKSNISYVFVKSFWISLPINAKKNLWGNTFFLQSIRTVWSSIWSSTVEVPFIFIDLCRFSIVDVPPSGPENVPKPGLPPYIQVTTFCRFEYLQRNNVGQMLWKCAPCPVHCKPD